MAYDQAKLISDVRIYLGGVTEIKLPDNVIIYYGDLHDSNPLYTGKQEFILWKTTLSCLDYLQANSASSSSSAAKSSRKEKVGDVEVTVTTDSSSSSATAVSYKDLYDDYAANPWKFGITVEASSVVHIGGVNQEEVDKYRNNTDTTDIYSPLPVTAFPKVTGCTWMRNNTSSGSRR